MHPESQKRNFFHTGSGDSQVSALWRQKQKERGFKDSLSHMIPPSHLKPDYLILHVRKPTQKLLCLRSRKIDGLVDKVLSVAQ